MFAKKKFYMHQELEVTPKTQNFTPLEFNCLIQKLRGFFLSKNCIEVFPQPDLSILAACEDPKTVRSFEFDGNIWPLPQTNQMHLERILMTNPELEGLFCLTASYRDEPNPIPQRHLKNFQMWEAEKKGDFHDLLKTLSELVVELGLVDKTEDIPFFTYNQLCEHYNTDLLTSEHETKMWHEFGDVVGITHFGSKTSPFFNMSSAGYDNGEEIFNKCDLIICGQETFGSAERSCDIEKMRQNFYTISEGEYSKLLFEKFGKDRVEKELEEFLSLEMSNRWGFGMGVQRLMRAMKLKDLI